MKTVPKKLLSILLALIMVFGCLSASFVSAQASSAQFTTRAAANPALKAALDNFAQAITDAGTANALGQWTAEGYIAAPRRQ